MTPLEEIEKAIEEVERGDYSQSPSYRLNLLGPLYQARAIERLEATVRHIGVILQAHFDPDQSPVVRQLRENRGQASRQHTFFNANPEAAICQICGYPRPAGIHYPEDRKDNG